MSELAGDPTRTAMDWDPDIGHPNRGRILAISCLSLVLVVLAVSSLNVAIPTLVESLRPTSSELLWIVDSYALVFAGHFSSPELSVTGTGERGPFCQA